MNKETLNTYNTRLSDNNDTITNINSLLKRLPVSGEDLTEELTDYDSGLTTQETSIQDIIEALEGKAAGGGGGKYAPRRITFTSFTGTELDAELANLDTSNMTSMLNMFQNCSNLTELNLTHFNTSSVTSLVQMFYGCLSLEKLDISSWDTSNVTETRAMFSRCMSLKYLDMRNADFTNVTNASAMFGNSDSTERFPADCLIIVKDDTTKRWITNKFTWLTNVKTVAELEG